MNHLGNTNKMVDTPRTNGCLTAILDTYGYVHQGNCPQRWVNHSRELERELNAANEKAQRYYEAILKHKAENEHLTDKIHQLYEGAEEQKQRIKRLLDTGDYLCAAAAFMGWHDKIEDWNKAKENK